MSPSWNGLSLKYRMSSTRMSQPASKRSARMLAAKSASVENSTRRWRSRARRSARCRGGSPASRCPRRRRPPGRAARRRPVARRRPATRRASRRRRTARRSSCRRRSRGRACARRSAACALSPSARYRPCDPAARVADVPHRGPRRDRLQRAPREPHADRPALGGPDPPADSLEALLQVGASRARAQIDEHRSGSALVRRSRTASRLSSLRSAGDSDRLSCCSSAICRATLLVSSPYRPQRSARPARGSQPQPRPRPPV